MISKHIYTYIQEKHITLPRVDEPFICYEVTFVTKYDYLLFGKVIKHKEDAEKVPFLFKSIEVAKDFCELNPIYKKRMLSNRKNVDHVHYYTYVLYNNANEKIAEAYWDKNFINVVHKDNGDYYYNNVISTPLVDKFAYELYIPCLVELNRYTNKKDALDWVWYATDKLSDLIRATIPIVNDTDNLYTYEMIQK